MTPLRILGSSKYLETQPNNSQKSQKLLKIRNSGFWTETRRHTHHWIALDALYQKNFTPSPADVFGARCGRAEIPTYHGCTPQFWQRLRASSAKTSKTLSSDARWLGKVVSQASCRALRPLFWRSGLPLTSRDLLGRSSTPPGTTWRRPRSTENDQTLKKK